MEDQDRVDKILDKKGRKGTSKTYQKILQEEDGKDEIWMRLNMMAVKLFQDEENKKRELNELIKKIIEAKEEEFEKWKGESLCKMCDKLNTSKYIYGENDSLVH